MRESGTLLFYRCRLYTIGPRNPGLAAAPTARNATNPTGDVIPNVAVVNAGKRQRMVGRGHRRRLIPPSCVILMRAARQAAGPPVQIVVTLALV